MQQRRQGCELNPKHVGGTGPVVGKIGRISRVFGGVNGGEIGWAGTVRILDRLTRLFSVRCDGGEGGIRSRDPRSHQRLRPDPKPSIHQIHSKSEYQVQNRYSAIVGPQSWNAGTSTNLTGRLSHPVWRLPCFPSASRGRLGRSSATRVPATLSASTPRDYTGSRPSTAGPPFAVRPQDNLVLSR